MNQYRNAADASRPLDQSLERRRRRGDEMDLPQADPLGPDVKEGP